ncbi:hypothetical protein BHM03_00056279 [Ensete ventricosum]|nr:hypothetical protein BHM03_00056279 [Ensete ventricosum]
MSQERLALDNLEEDVPLAMQPTSGGASQPLPPLPLFGDGNSPSCTPGRCVSELRIDDVHKTIQMKDKHGESSPCGSPFIQEIQDTPILQHFHLPALEAYDSGSDPMEHVTAFMAHMALYGMSNAIMCWVFSTTLCGVARGWYRRLSPAFICSFDQLARERPTSSLVPGQSRLSCLDRTPK